MTSACKTPGIACPHCGPRELSEFQFRSVVPEPGSEALSALYTRVNHMNRSTEYWQHLRGCRAWLVIQRNPSTGQVLDVCMLGAPP